MSKLYDNAKRATLKETRALKVGDVIECYYMDSETPQIEMVVQATFNSKEGDYRHIQTIPECAIGTRYYSRWLNTDKFKLIRRASF